MKLRLLEWIFRIFTGSVFLYASIPKILNPCDFALDIFNYKIAPFAVINLVAITLPYIELIFGLFLILGILPRGAAMGLCLILMFFMSLMIINLIRGVNFECGCFGSGRDLCMIIVDRIKAAHPGITAGNILKLRIWCDIIRDIIIFIPAAGSLLLINKRMYR